MKKIILVLIALISLSAIAEAQMKISELLPGTPAQNSDAFPIQRGNKNYKLTVLDIKNSIIPLISNDTTHIKKTDSIIFVSLCSGCLMESNWKYINDTIYIDTTYVNKTIVDSLTNHLTILKTWINDSSNIVHYNDTATYIATKDNVDTLSNSVYDSLSNHYDLIHGLDTGKVSTSGDVMYGGLNIKQGNLSVKGTFNVGNVPLGTDIDSVTVIENGQLKSVDGSSFKPDSTSAGCFNNFYYKQITGCDNNNLYIKSDTTKFSNYIKLLKFSSLGRPLLTVKDLSGNIDTTETIDIETTPFGFITLTDSMNIGGITYYNYSGDLADDEDFSFPLNSYGFGNVYVFNAGMKVEYCRFILNIDGSFELQDNSANVQFSNVDGNVCLYSNAIQNRLGGTRYFMIELKKN